MRLEWIAVLALVLPTTTTAQEISQKLVRTEKIVGTPVGIGLYDIAADGTVLVDWRAVEAAAGGPADRTLTPVAQMMLAVRDGKWKPMTR